ncbi:hypothetical protein [Arthrobacter sp. ISL-30]|uniref:hypothetical protein n=1 Tax=Arthrobacter sp. ISL-30 TaxID=2819109 RepID=UPI001BEA8DF5|nr:hypothetical protein [Arthrobacter sp. ISL-30]MBT2514360.1 hypothetical protein [Arthrobacter sp. ISL-30]
MDDSLVVDVRGTLRPATPATGTGHAGKALTGHGPPHALRRLDVKGRIECGVLAVGALLIATAYILVPLVSALYFMIHTVFVAFSIGLALIIELALMITYVIRRTETHAEKTKV